MSTSTFVSAGTVFNVTARASAAVGAVLAQLARVAAFFKVDSAQRERDWQEAYLAESADRYELDYRMRELDRADAKPYWMTGLHR